MEVVCIIPARGGSKSIPKKNIYLLKNKPLISYVIQQALNSTYKPRVFVSTDSIEIAEVASAFGAEIIMQPDDISQDQSPSEHSLLFALEHLRVNEKYIPEITAFLQCTSPLTEAEDIDGTVEALIQNQADTALTVTPFHYFLWESQGNGEAIGINHDKSIRLRRQDRSCQYLETGAVYVMRTEGFIKHKHRFFGKTVFHVMPRERVFEIDEPCDFQIAEALLESKLIR